MRKSAKAGKASCNGSAYLKDRGWMNWMDEGQRNGVGSKWCRERECEGTVGRTVSTTFRLAEGARIVHVRCTEGREDEHRHDLAKRGHNAKELHVTVVDHLDGIADESFDESCGSNPFSGSFCKGKKLSEHIDLQRLACCATHAKPRLLLLEVL